MMIGCPECGCADCNCTDDYSAAGTGGAGRPCPFTDGDSLDISGGELAGTEGTTIVFANGPDTSLTATTELTIVCQPSDSDGPSTIQLRAGIDGANYVYGQLSIDSGDVTISVGTQDEELDTENAGTGGIAEFVTLALCYKPPVATGTSDGVRAGAETVTGGAGWSDPENVLTYNDGTFATPGSLGDDQTSSPIGVHFFPMLPTNATITRMDLEVRCREDASPANGIEDAVAQITAGAVTLADKAAFDPIPAPSFGLLSYTWSGGELAGVTTASCNSIGVSGSTAFHMPSGSGGGTQPDVDHVLLAIFFTHPIKTPGRITLTYTKGMTTECVSAITVDAIGGGFPGLSFVADDWQVTSTEINCSSATCDTCDDGDPDLGGCNDQCCDEETGRETITNSLSIGPFTPDSGSEEDCCTSVSGDYVVDIISEEDCGVWEYHETIPCESGGDREFHIQVYLTTVGGGMCRWEADMYCSSSAGAIYRHYDGPNIVAFTDPCDEFPYTLTKQSEILFGTADDTVFPDEVTLDLA